MHVTAFLICYHMTSWQNWSSIYLEPICWIPLKDREMKLLDPKTHNNLHLFEYSKFLNSPFIIPSWFAPAPSFRLNYIAIHSDRPLCLLSFNICVASCITDGVYLIEMMQLQQYLFRFISIKFRVLLFAISILYIYMC